MTEEWWIWCKRRHAKEATSANEVTNLYQANELNQYTNINAGAVESVYDADGNMTSYGSLQFTWDAENRLISVASNGVPVVQNQYDYMSRRIMKTTATQTHTLLYDGWNLIRERVEFDGAVSTNQYVWGLDLSGTLQGAGGVGGLLAMLTPDSGLLTPVYDANGNVTDVLDKNGAVVAHYEYDGFGNAIARSGDQADTNPFRFSSKYWDGETGLYYYGYRHYSPDMGRWLNRDPIEEGGGNNLYAFSQDPISKIDYLGLSFLCWCPAAVPPPDPSYGPPPGTLIDGKNCTLNNQGEIISKKVPGTDQACEDRFGLIPCGCDKKTCSIQTKYKCSTHPVTGKPFWNTTTTINDCK